MGLDEWDLTREYSLYYIDRLVRSKIDLLALNFNNDIFAFLKNEKNILFVLNFFKFNSLLNFNFFCDMTTIDFFYSKIRYKIVYNLMNINFALRCILSLFIINTFNFILSISFIYPSAIWSEREIWDMFGIFFINNNSLKRILTDYGFKGHPLKKDFPLIGYLEVYYHYTVGEMAYKLVELTQEYRFYNVDSSWEI